MGPKTTPVQRSHGGIYSDHLFLLSSLYLFFRRMRWMKWQTSNDCATFKRRSLRRWIESPMISNKECSRFFPIINYYLVENDAGVNTSTLLIFIRLAQVPHTLAPSTLIKDGQQMSSEAFFEEMNVCAFYLVSSHFTSPLSRNVTLSTISPLKSMQRRWSCFGPAISCWRKTMINFDRRWKILMSIRRSSR